MSFINPENISLIKLISNKNSKSEFINLPIFYKSFQYPVSLEFSEAIGRKAYQKEVLDVLEFFCILTNKIYTTIIKSQDAGTLSDFILKEDNDKFKMRAKTLIKSIKEYESAKILEKDFSETVQDFCLNTTGVRLPVMSFFLRCMLPEKFATIDFHAIKALKAIGFTEIKELPTTEFNIDEYFNKFSVSDYLSYNKLLLEMGQHYTIHTTTGIRKMSPSEVDMALFTFDKSKLKYQSKTYEYSDIKNKIAKIKLIIDDIVQGAYEASKVDWVVKGNYSGMVTASAEKLRRVIESHAKNDDLDGIYSYCINALSDDTGIRVSKILKGCNKKTLEDMFPEIKKICEN